MKQYRFPVTGFYCILMMMLPISTVMGSYHYELHKIHGQVVHLVRINPAEYTPHLVRAKGDRETVSSMAKRTQAKIAINGGFFEMGNLREGFPAGSLVIEGKVYQLKNKVQALAIIQGETLKIEQTNAKQYIQTHPGRLYSLVSGIPLLIYKGKIIEENLNKKSDFYKKPHARTAIGIGANGEIIVCVAEHVYGKELTQNSKNISHFFKKNLTILNAYYRQKKGELTHKEFKKVVKNELETEGVQGMTMEALARFMKQAGCEFALNLDGGGSSTLYIEGKVVNATIGDEDEGQGLSVLRPVSDAIVFYKK